MSDKIDVALLTEEELRWLHSAQDIRLDVPFECVPPARLVTCLTRLAALRQRCAELDDLLLRVRADLGHQTAETAREYNARDTAERQCAEAKQLVSQVQRGHVDTIAARLDRELAAQEQFTSAIATERAARDTAERQCAEMEQKVARYNELCNEMNFTNEQQAVRFAAVEAQLTTAQAAEARTAALQGEVERLRGAIQRARICIENGDPASAREYLVAESLTLQAQVAVTLTSLCAEAGFRLVVDPRYHDRLDAIGQHGASPHAQLCTGRVIAVGADSPDAVFSVSHELAHGLFPESSEGTVRSEQMDILVSWVRRLMSRTGATAVTPNPLSAAYLSATQGGRRRQGASADAVMRRVRRGEKDDV